MTEIEEQELRKACLQEALFAGEIRTDFGMTHRNGMLFKLQDEGLLKGIGAGPGVHIFTLNHRDHPDVIAIDNHSQQEGN